MAMRAHQEDQPTDDELIARWVETAPAYPTPDEARITDYGMSVTALIQYLQAVEGDLDETASAYEVPMEALHAAIAYYERHKKVIDARIVLNVAEYS